MGKRKKTEVDGTAAADLNSYDFQSSAGSGEPSQKRLRLNSTDGVVGAAGKRVRFDAVTLFYFERSQGFSCVPTHGGCTLGMTDNHHSVRRLSLSQHERELHDSRSGDKSGPPLREELDDDSLNGDESVDMSTTDEEEEEEVEELAESDDVFFLQPLGSKQRKVMLKTAGVDDVSREEREELKQIRKSREICGCQCRESCLPESCFCIQNNIKCQVDRMSFPCGCTKEGCQNPVGRVEFNPIRVRSHYLTTMMRLRLEERRLSGLATATLTESLQGETVTSPTHVRFFDDNSYCDETAQISQLSMTGRNSVVDSQSLNGSYQAHQVQFRGASARDVPPPPFPRFESVFGLSGAMQTGRSYTLLSPQHPTVPQTSYSAADSAYESGAGNSYWSDGKFRSERNLQTWKLANNSGVESQQQSFFDASHHHYATGYTQQSGVYGDDSVAEETRVITQSSDELNVDGSLASVACGDSALSGVDTGAEHPALELSSHAGSCEDPSVELHNFHHFNLCDFGVDPTPLCFCCSFSPPGLKSESFEPPSVHLENPISYATVASPPGHHRHQPLAVVTQTTNGCGEASGNGPDLSDPLATPPTSFEDSTDLDSFGRHRGPKSELKLILQSADESRSIQEGPDSSDISADSGFDEETDSVSSCEADFCPTFSIASLYPHVQQRHSASSANPFLSADSVSSGQMETSIRLSGELQLRDDSATTGGYDNQSHRSTGQLGTVLKESICETG